MGYGDAIMATARVRDFGARGKLAAFSLDGKTIKWTVYCEQVFKNNPNIARPGMEGARGIEWLEHYKHTLPYCTYDGVARQIWNPDFKLERGEFFFGHNEQPTLASPFIAIEPNVTWRRMSTINKDWGDGKYEQVADALKGRGYRIVQFIHQDSRRRLKSAQQVAVSGFRQAVIQMRNASLIIAPEGANHHVAAVLGVPAVILWGAWSPPALMGYKEHIMLTGGAGEACGSVLPCEHCRAAFNRITVDDVVIAAEGIIHGHTSELQQQRESAAASRRVG